MATIKLATTARNAAADAVVDLIDAGAGAGTIKIYTGSMPADPQTGATGTLLATLTFSGTAFGAAATGVATADTITADASADDTGTAGWARIADGNGNTIMDCDVGVSASGAAIEFDSVSFEAGGAINITALTYTQPETYTS
jgi:hypothetical protein